MVSLLMCNKNNSGPNTEPRGPQRLNQNIDKMTCCIQLCFESNVQSKVEYFAIVF